MLISHQSASPFSSRVLGDQRLGTLNKLKCHQLTILILQFEDFNPSSSLEVATSDQSSRVPSQEHFPDARCSWKLDVVFTAF